MATENLLYVAAPLRAIDFAVRRADGVIVGAFNGKTIAELEAEYGAKVECGTRNDYQAVHDAYWRTPPARITAEEWDEALNALPPEGWCKVNGVESFKMSEYLSGGITTIYARKGECCWSFRDSAALPARDIAERITGLC